MKRNVLSYPGLLELKKHRRKVFKNKILFFIFAILVIFAGLAYLSRISRLKIIEISVIGNNVTDSELIKISAKKELTGNYLWLFPKNNILYYPKKNIENELKNEFKRLKDITFRIKGIEDENSDEKYLEISVSEREAEYLWCGDTMPAIPGSGEKCHFLDKDGYVFDEAPYFSGEVYFKFYGLAHRATAEGKLPPDFTKLILFKETLKDLGLNPVALYNEENGDIKIFLSRGNTLSMGPEIIFKSDADLSIIAENLQAALTTEPLQSNFKNKYSSLLYIDLRFGNKVYYKFK